MFNETIKILKTETKFGTEIKFARIIRTYKNGSIHVMSLMLDRLSEK